jgi:hypothetical protein
MAPELLRWRKSSHSAENGNCVEIALFTSGGAAVRHSKNPDGPALIFTRGEWQAFLRAAKEGEFDQ